MRNRQPGPPQRVPHEDPRVEAQIQQVLSRYAAIRRAGERLEDIRAEQKIVDRKVRRSAGSSFHHQLVDRARVLYTERLELEAFISNTHHDISQILDAMGDSALYLGAL